MSEFSKRLVSTVFAFAVLFGWSSIRAHADSTEQYLALIKRILDDPMLPGYVHGTRLKSVPARYPKTHNYHIVGPAKELKEGIDSCFIIDREGGGSDLGIFLTNRDMTDSSNVPDWNKLQPPVGRLRRAVLARDGMCR